MNLPLWLDPFRDFYLAFSISDYYNHYCDYKSCLIDFCNRINFPNLFFSTDEVLKTVCLVQNGRLKVLRICNEVIDLMNHGVFLPPNMQGLLEEQISELKLSDDEGDKSMPQGGFEFQKDPVGRRNGKAPNRQMRDVLVSSLKFILNMISITNNFFDI